MKTLYIPVSPTSTSLPNTVHVLVQAPPNFPYSYQNIKFYHPSVGPVPSWYEGNGIWFVRVPAGVPLQSLYAVVFDNPVLDGQTVGVSPYVQLGYDNGPNVFNLYTNFQFDNPEIDKWNLVNAGFMLRDPNSGLPTSLQLNTTLLSNLGTNPNNSAIARNDGPTDYNQVVEISTSYWVNPSNGSLTFYVGLWGFRLQYIVGQVGNTGVYVAAFAVAPVGGVEIHYMGGNGITVLYGSDAMAVYTSGLIPQPNATVNLFFQAYFLQNSISAYYATSNSFFTSGVYNTNQLTPSFTYQSSSPLPKSGDIFVYGFGRQSYNGWASTDFSNTYWIRVRGVLPNGQTPIAQIQLPMS